MLSTIALFFILALITVTNANEICNGQIDKLDVCMAVVQFPGDCNSATVNLTNTDYEQCNSTNFFWSYPLHNLTFIIKTSWTTKHQPFTLYFANHQLMSGVSHVYRIFNNQETDVTTEDKTLVQYSDSNYEVIIKFQGPVRLQRYGVNINYDVISS